MIKKIFVLSDSLPLPRQEPEVCRLEETWPELLKPHYGDLYRLSIGGGTVSDLQEQLAYHMGTLYDAAIIQLGIVDAAPRIMTREEKVVLNYFWLSRTFLLPLVFKFKARLRSRRLVTYTPIDVFRAKLTEIKKTLGVSYVLALGILPGQEGYERILPGVSRNIERYNEAIKDVFGDGFVDLSQIPASGIMADFHHLTPLGHQFVYRQLMDKLGYITRTYGNIGD